MWLATSYLWDFKCFSSILFFLTSQSWWEQLWHWRSIWRRTQQLQQLQPLRGLWSVESVSSAPRTAVCGRWPPRPPVLSEPQTTMREGWGVTLNHTPLLLHTESFTLLGVPGKHLARLLVKVSCWGNVGLIATLTLQQIKRGPTSVKGDIKRKTVGLMC